jgi:hypothetical protein
MQLRRRKLGWEAVEGGAEAATGMNPAFGSGELSIRRAASACPPQQQEVLANQNFLYRTGSDGSPLYFQSDNSMASSASRLSPETILSMQKPPPKPEVALTKSWSDPHMTQSEPDAPAQVTGQGGFGASSAGLPPAMASNGFPKMPKIEEQVQPAVHLHSAQRTDSDAGQAPTGELLNEFSRALGENLNRDAEEEADRQATDGQQVGGNEDDYLPDEQGSPKAPSRRGPRGTSSKYRGVTRHRCFTAFTSQFLT